MAYKLFEDKQITYLLNQIKIYKPEYFFDVGAHGGLYSIILKTNFPNLTILSFEPDKQNRFQFYGNIFLNNLENDIKVQNYGLSSSSKNVTFGIQENQNRGGKTIQENGDNKILVKSLDEISSLKNKKCFLKIDVEGHELDVIKGARRFLKENLCFIQVEILSSNDLNAFDTLMFDLGYKLNHKITDYYYSNIIK